jgi:hypothetical protein
MTKREDDDMKVRAWRASLASVVVVAAAAMAVAALAPPSTSVGASSPPADGFTPIAPARVMDTRAGLGGPQFEAGAERVVSLAGVVPAGATGVAINLTATEPTTHTFLTVYPAGVARPSTSNLNVAPGMTRPNAVLVGLGPDRSVTIHHEAGSTHVVVDVMGYFTAGFTGIEPRRVMDTRGGRGGPTLEPGGVATLQVAGVHEIPATATAVALNVTGTGATAPTFVTVHPAGENRPPTSSLNVGPGDTLANHVVAKVGAGGAVSVYNDVGTVDVVVDVMGYFDSAGGYRSLAPARLFDSRPSGQTVDGQARSGGLLTGGTVHPVRVGGRGGVLDGSTSVVLNVTVTGAVRAGYLTVFPCGLPTPPTSNVNFEAGTATANGVVVGVSTVGRVCLYLSGPAHVVIDVAGHHGRRWAANGLDRGMIVNTTPGNTVFSAIAPWIDGVGYLRVWGGTRGMSTYPTLDAVPTFLRSRPNHYHLVADAEIQWLLEMQARHGVGIIYMVNINDTLASQHAFVTRLVDAGIDLQMLEMGQELYLTKFRQGDTAQKGVTRSFDVGSYMALLDEWVPTMRSFGVPIYTIGASHGPTFTGGDVWRRQWNVEMQAALAARPGFVDGITFHMYAGEARTGQPHEEEILPQNFEYLSTFGELPIAITEAGYTFFGYTPENLERSADFWTALAEALKPGDVFGLHILFAPGSWAGSNSWALFDEGGRTPVGDRLAQWLDGG